MNTTPEEQIENCFRQQRKGVLTELELWLAITRIANAAAIECALKVEGELFEKQDKN